MKAALREDLENACQELQGFLTGKTRNDLQHDRALQLIVEREFEIIGEALHRLQGRPPAGRGASGGMEVGGAYGMGREFRTGAVK